MPEFFASFHLLLGILSLLQKNPQAAAFYDSCTPTQRQAILFQMGQITSQSQLRAFVDNLPSATL